LHHLQREGLRIFRAVWLLVVALIAACSFATAQEAEKPKQAPAGKSAKLKREAAKTDKGVEALPCPRATYKDDPVCFGADDKDALPMPHGPAAAQERPADGLRVKPTTSLNARPTGVGPYQGGVVYQSNGNAVTNNYGGGVKMELPF
jgi:hypothetical protein